MSDTRIKAICFYLPQYHPIPENDEWWGRGFTEWRNVAKAKPLFPGHYQPHLPADVGFYDLRLPEVREIQAELARQHSIHGFCYYHYWFNGRRILERPFNEVLASGKPDLPFCLCWANENWTRVWDGGERNVLLEQHYSHEDDLAHIRSLIPAFKDPRYICIDGKPLFLVYRTELLPDPEKTASIWQEEAKKAGLPGLYLVRVENFVKDVDPGSIGFDAAVEFAPDSSKAGKTLFRGHMTNLLVKLNMLPTVFRDSRVYSYPATVQGMLSKPEPSYRWFRCVSPMWDNSARRSVNANIFIGATPSIYKQWLSKTVARTRQRHTGDEQIVFINAWNEWAEGCHLEPDQKWGRAYLEATRDALAAPVKAATSSAALPNAPSHFTRFYWRISESLSKIRTVIAALLWHLKHRLPPQ
ncbi:Glycosyltransferase WbsX [Candidatus Nitrotoga sp. HW29]|uniref:glycosyltransferase WbsX family protein n=1 Tax=Candidatus Nitrotoga sp. HW29 TaxID=2886963 RepID=UPI001EF16B8E|nr:glycoside hydrolase family 99-like domain-containing protein [Candidatus Nitrotoga sp. HW29]CAH1904804.1 Glycosyltransferase WbsX [Candidatus Nitrotoga sp. HW29]